MIETKVYEKSRFMRVIKEREAFIGLNFRFIDFHWLFSRFSPWMIFEGDLDLLSIVTILSLKDKRLEILIVGMRSKLLFLPDFILKWGLISGDYFKFVATRRTCLPTMLDLN